MKNKTLFVLSIIFTFIFLSTLASSKNIKISVDWAIFQYDQQNLFVEVYYSLLQNDIDYINENNNFVGKTLGRLLVHKGNEVIQDFTWKNQNVVADSFSLQEQKLIVDRLGFKLQPGEYFLKLVLRDLNNPVNADSCGWSLSLTTPEINAPYLSDIELATSITQNPQSNDSPFYKNTLVVMPNPSLIYGLSNPALFFYVEAYNLPSDILPDGYQLNYYITDSADQPIETMKPRTIEKSQVVDPSVEFGVMNVGRLSSGIHKLHVKILDSNGSVIASQSKKFYIYQENEVFAPETKQETAAVAPVNIFQQMDSSQIEDDYLMSSYLMDNDTKNIWSKLDNLEGKRNFLYQFWRINDTDPATPENEFRQEYTARIKYANQHFHAFKREGWRTDRGRVYMVYGAPSDIEYHPNEPNYYPYEIWYYHHLQSGVIFVFADFEGYKNYRLLHSNLLGEIQNYNYMDSVQKGF